MARIQNRRGTAADIASVNPVLLAGEIVFETDTNKFKLGNGSTAWNSLPYAVLPSSGVVISGINILSGSGNFSSLNVNNIPVSVSGHSHGNISFSGAIGSTSGLLVLTGSSGILTTSSGISSSYISNFNSSVSGLLPTILNSGDNRLLTSTGTSTGINAESNLTFDGSLLSISGNIIANTGDFSVLRVNSTGVSLSNHTHGNISNDGKLSGSGTLVITSSNGSIITPSITTGFTVNTELNTVSVSYGTTSLTACAGDDSRLSDSRNPLSHAVSHSSSGTDPISILSSQISDFNENVDDRVSNLLVAGSGISLDYNDGSNTLTINTSGLQPSGNYSVMGHTHTASEITDFNSSVSGLVSGIYQPLLTNPVTGVGTSGYIPRWTSTSGMGNSIIFDNATNIGISTASPLQKLDVRGNVYASGNVGIGVSSPSGQLNVIGTGLFSSVTDISPNALLQTYSAVSGATLFSADGTNGNLFTIVDSLSGSLMSVNNIAGLPIFEVFSDDSVVAGRYNQNDFVINSSGNIGIGAAANNSYKLQAVGNVNVSGILSIDGVSAKSKTIASFVASDNMPPASSYATLDTRNGILILDFDDASTEYAVFSSVIPEAANLASGLAVYINWTAFSATGNNCVWQAEFKDMDDDLDSITYGTAVTATSAANATNGTPSVATITLSSAQIDGLVAGDYFLLRIARLGGNASDTMTGDAELINVEVRTVA